MPLLAAPEPMKTAPGSGRLESPPHGPDAECRIGASSPRVSMAHGIATYPNLSPTVVGSRRGRGSTLSRLFLLRDARPVGSLWGDRSVDPAAKDREPSRPWLNRAESGHPRFDRPSASSSRSSGPHETSWLRNERDRLALSGRRCCRRRRSWFAPRQPTTCTKFSEQQQRHQDYRSRAR